MIKNVLCYDRNSLWSHHSFLSVDIPYFFVRDFFFLHRADVIYSKRQYILVIDCIDDCICMKLITKSLLSCHELWCSDCSGILCKDWRSCKTKDMILLKVLYNRSMHVAKLRSMAFIEDDYNMLLINIVAFILLNKSSQFLNCCNNDVSVLIFKLFLKNCC